MDSKMSVSEVITSMVTNVASFIFIIIYCIFYSCIITLQDFYSFLRLVFRLLSYPILVSCMSPSQLSNTSNVVQDDASTSEPCPKIEVTRDDVEIVMEKLGLKNDPRVQDPLMLHDSFEIVIMFDEREPSLDEVREAFGVFDENNDGFVDAKELKRVMSSLGLEGLCEQECQRMIMAFDDDGDGRIDFGEFVKLIEENVCC